MIATLRPLEYSAVLGHAAMAIHMQKFAHPTLAYAYVLGKVDREKGQLVTDEELADAYRQGLREGTE